MSGDVQFFASSKEFRLENYRRNGPVSKPREVLAFWVDEKHVDSMTPEQMFVKEN